jgi:hypothetical protein
VVYLFFFSSLVSSFLFVSPKTIHAPLQKGVSLLFFVLFLFCFWKQRKAKFVPKKDSVTMDHQTKVLPRLVFVSALLFIVSSSYHAYELTNFFVNSFLFHDADYIGISDVLLSLWEGKGYESHYYSESVNGSYLEHHFAPGMFFLSPFVGLVPDRFGLALGVFFFYQLTVVFFILWSYQIIQKNNPEISIPFLVIWVILTNQMYLYRIGSSFHFEILVVMFGSIFFYVWEKTKRFKICFPTYTTFHFLLFGNLPFSFSDTKRRHWDVFDFVSIAPFSFSNLQTSFRTQTLLVERPFFGSKTPFVCFTYLHSWNYDRLSLLCFCHLSLFP